MSRSVIMPLRRLSSPQMGSAPTPRSRILRAASVTVSFTPAHSTPDVMISRAVVIGSSVLVVVQALTGIRWRPAHTGRGSPVGVVWWPQGDGRYQGTVEKWPATRHRTQETTMSIMLSPAAAQVSREERRDRTTELFLPRAESHDPAEQARLTEELVRINTPVPRDATRRFRDRGISNEDIEQVSYLGLIKAVQGFDPARGHDFLSFAIPTIRGEVRRYFRDHGWAVRPT